MLSLFPSIVKSLLLRLSPSDYSVLIAYLILELMKIPAFYGNKLLDKLRYLQLELSRQCSIVHWSYDWLPDTLV